MFVYRIYQSAGQHNGCDIVSLNYHVDGAFATIFTDSCHFIYLLLFSYPWRVRHMEFPSNKSWKQRLDVQHVQ
ncbi:unnamed protein product, partial [Schistosoma spindalis]